MAVKKIEAKKPAALTTSAGGSKADSKVTARKTGRHMARKTQRKCAN